MLSIIANLDGNIQQYVKPSKVWSTVTPVIMPGYDDGKEAKGERILRRAFEQAGVASELVAGAELEWRRVGFRPGVELSTRYQLPETIRRPTYHVRVRFTHPVAGPLAVGAGRYRGFGIFAREDD